MDATIQQTTPSTSAHSQHELCTDSYTLVDATIGSRVILGATLDAKLATVLDHLGLAVPTTLRQPDATYSTV